MSAAKLRIIVLGGGVFGVASALELRRRGHDVTLLDAGTVPRAEAASTDTSRAIRMDYGADTFYTELMELAFERWDAWNREWPRSLYHQTGVLFLAGAAMERGGFEHDSYHTLSARGHMLERIGGARLEERFPAWCSERFPDGYFNPRAGWAESGEVVRHLAALARDAGVDVREAEAVLAFAGNEHRVEGVVTAAAERVRADRVLACTGAWTPTLLPELAGRMRASGQPLLYLRPEAPERFAGDVFPVWCADIANTGWYGFPSSADGTVKVGHHGAGYPVGPDDERQLGPTARDAFEAAARAFLVHTIPALADAPVVKSRLCLYCDTDDGDFLIDAHPDRQGLYVAAGGSGHGFKFAPVIGEVIADRVEDRPDRFGDRLRWRENGGRKEAARHRGDPGR